MALETLAALGVASNIVQFIEFGCRLFSESRELYKSSKTLVAEHVELEAIASSLTRLSDNLLLTHGYNQLPPDGSDLIALAQSCKEIANELLTALDQLKAKGSRGKWKCFRIALTKVWKSDMISNISRRLHLASGQLTTCLIRILKYGKVSVTIQTVC